MIQNFFSTTDIYIYIYIYMDTMVDHFTLLALRVRGNNIKILKFLADWILLNTKLYSEGCRVSEYLGQSEINVLQEAKSFVTMVFQN